MASTTLHTRLSAIALYLLAVTTTTTTTIVNAHVLVPFSRNTEHHADGGHQLSARAENAVGTKLTSNLYSYVVKATIGTPPQEVSLIVNPSVGDTWVPDGSRTPCAGSSKYRYCDMYEDYPEYYKYDPSEWADKSPTCVEGRVNTSGSCRWGSFLKSNSETYLPGNSRKSDFAQTTVEDISVSGLNFTDKLTVGEIEIDDYPMGLATSSSRYIGVLGLGRNSSSSSSSWDSDYYVNFIDRLVRADKIKSPAYSIWLDNPEGSSGNLLFGAIDKAKYEGDLIRISAASSYVFSRTFGVELHSINGTKKSGEAMPSIRSNDFPLSVTISPGDVYSYLPERIADSIGSMVGARYSSSLGLMTIPCDAATQNPVSFTFQLNSEGGPVLNVETADLVLPMEIMYSSSSSRSSPSSSNTCIFGIQQWSTSSSSSSYYSSYSTSYFNLGSALLKRTYMVFDVANRAIALAPVKFSASSSDVVPFKKWGDNVPSAKSFDGSALCNEDEYSSSGTCYKSNGGSGSRGSGYGYPNVDGTSHWNKVALGVGITFGLLFLISIIAAVVICVRRAKAKKGQNKEADVEGGETSGDDAAATARAVPGGPPAGTSLPVIQEGQEMSQTAPQLPALSVTPPPAEEPRQNSDAVSALSDEPQSQLPAQTQAPGLSEQPTAEDAKGKGKEVDRSPESEK
ncbi:aspartic peptidase domain-containing protein [Cladorrhinum sp. PSN332]|nr:aspartic peptidase domain-containing protein [Cladorrhinum sp. PSN332]